MGLVARRVLPLADVDRAVGVHCVARPEVVAVHVRDLHVVVVPVDGAEEEACRHADDEGRPGRPCIRRVGGPTPAAVDDPRIIVGYVDHARVGLLDDDRVAVGDHAQAFVGRQLPRSLRALAQALHGLHHLRFLFEEGVAEAPRALELLVHALQQGREGDQRFHARVPVFGGDLRNGLVALQSGMGARPARGFDHVERIGRGHQDLRQQRVWVERDRGEHLVELGLRIGLGGRRGLAEEQGEQCGAESFHGRHLRPLFSAVRSGIRPQVGAN